jgi:hypothetical protein
MTVISIQFHGDETDTETRNHLACSIAGTTPWKEFHEPLLTPRPHVLTILRRTWALNRLLLSNPKQSIIIQLPLEQGQCGIGKAAGKDIRGERL